MFNDTDHWSNLKQPLAPNEEEIGIYKTAIDMMGENLLLGYTKELKPLCNRSVDNDPNIKLENHLCLDWFDMKDISVDLIIGDGVLNLYGPQLLPVIMKHCNVFMSRVFVRKVEGMRYAKYFMADFYLNKDFVKPKMIHLMTNDDAVICIWKNKLSIN